MTTSDYLTQLQQDRENLISSLEAQGITGLTGDETFTELVPQCSNLETIKSYWNEIGFTDEPKSLKDSHNYALQLKNNWQPASDLSYKMDGNKNIIYMPGVDTSTATTMEYMFRDCTNMSCVGNFNVSNVSNMKGLFWGCWGLKDVDFTNWNTANLTTFRSTFGYCTGLTEIDMSNIVGTNVETTYQMFTECSSLTKVDLSSFNPSNITDVARMFYNCKLLTHIDIRSLDVHTVGFNYGQMFGNSASEGVPDNCLIIVKDATQKNWYNTNIPRLTNVKTVEEYEAS